MVLIMLLGIDLRILPVGSVTLPVHSQVISAYVGQPDVDNLGASQSHSPTEGEDRHLQRIVNIVDLLTNRQ